MNRQASLLKLIITSINENPVEDVTYLPPSFSKGLYSTYYSLDDVDLAKKYTMKIMEIVETIEATGDRTHEFIAEGLWYGMVAIYGRCFTDSGKGFVKLEKSMFNKQEDLLSTHTELMELRHQFVAHRDDTFRLESAISLVKDKANPRDAYFLVKTQRSRFDKADLVRYLLVFDHLLLEICELQKKHLKRLVTKLVETGPQEFAAQSEAEIQKLMEEAGEDILLLYDEMHHLAIKGLLEDNSKPTENE